ncbi:MAG: hypothetical protein LC102_09180 [Ignavibacteriales bacterium]|jgi:SOS-response transcriptional repressors (RecA-mediated autopeptidases)|nr:MAG: hypothetical protein F9K26_05470 [Ignavibacteriaceae bacterium]MBW7872867.1 hypothetical protein [Ignavibacteria bacterium]MCZ2143587.1 hypothetical protein [Ignavibacteriales bacterium]MBV6444461.1 LexA repressor [Ignavibacteriaceae bacterium]MBZ0197267.1 hypothetical protein [Ignavibacteriaceae bacterium]
MEIDKKSVAQRLKSFLITRFGSVKVAAEALGKTPDNLYNGYLNGRSIPGGELLGLLTTFGCDIDWLLTGKIKEKPSKLIKEFPLVSMVGAGSVIPFDDQTPQMIPFPFKGEAVVLRVVGDSMASLISDGDLVLVDIINRPKLGNIVAVRTKEEEQFVKYFGAYNEDTVMFYSHNAYYSPVTFKKKEIITIKKVVFILKDVDWPDTINSGGK